MDAQDLKNIFEKRYNREDWYKIAKELLSADQLLAKPAPIKLPDNEWGAEGFELGNLETTDGRLIGLYELVIGKKAQLHRNRKGLKDLLVKVYKENVDAALIVFVQGAKWRFSYVSEIYIRNKETGKRERKATDPKRYTYLLGEGERCKTAADRFVRIKQSSSLFQTGVTLEALEEAFNVEKMSKAFFNEYRKHYGAFTAFLTGKNEDGKEVRKAHPFLRSIFNGDEKDARDFVKKLLGRIVFLYFLQKKGWLGVPEGGKWGEGNEDFLHQLFLDYKDKEGFYALVLAPLFFETLNTERDGDLFKIKSSFFTKPGYNKLKLPYLNGGLFDNDQPETDQLDFPRELFEKLFLFFDQYNFTVYEDSPDEHTVAVDPEMLGHIFENLLEDNKDKGAYYTPKEIVHYMCRESLIEYLYTKLNPSITESYQELGKTQTDIFGNKGKEGQLSLVKKNIETKEQVDRDTIEKFIKNHEAAAIIDWDESILKALKEIKVCDPAIGSGAFPMGILMEIFHAVETLFYANPDTVNSIWKLGNDNAVFNAAKAKESIIQNSIYGVDIEKGAVDIARLRFWLSLVVDETKPKPLPNLDYKIVVGNSLLSKFEDEVIDIDWELNTTRSTEANKVIVAQQASKLNTLQAWQTAYFNEKREKTKQQLEIRNIKIDILINQLTLSKISFQQSHPKLGGFAPITKEIQKNSENELMLAGYDKTIKKLEALKRDKKAVLEFFDWKLDFPQVMNEKVNKEKVGFDIVIGNPPYVGEKGHADIFENLKRLPKWKAFYRRRSNTYYFFIKSGIDLLKECGVQSLIVPREFTTADWANKVRRAILENTKLLEIIDFERSKVFKEAGTSSLILTHKKIVSNNHIFKLKSFVKEFSPNQSELDNQSFIPVEIGKITNEEFGPWAFDDFTIVSSDKIVPLANFFQISQGIVTGADRVTPKHVEKSLISESLLGRGIFILKEGIDVKVEGNNTFLKIKDNWVELSKESKALIKPYFKTENFKKWSVSKGNTYLIYSGKQILTKQIENYLYQFVKILINRATIIEDAVITYDEFKNFTKEDIKIVYSSAGAVQKVMKSKRWHLPLYERVDVPFEGDKIVVNTKNMNLFSYSNTPVYSSGGGSGGQNFIYPDKNVFNIKGVDISDYTIFINAVLNSKLIQHYIKTRQYNQLSTNKISELPIPNIKAIDFELFTAVVSRAKKLISLEGSVINQNLENRIEKVNRELDKIIYHLYESPYDEACIIEGNTAWTTKEEYENITFETLAIAEQTT